MKPRKTCVELMRNIDADYYGYRDEDDNILLPIEQIAEQKGSSYLNLSIFIILFLYYTGLLL